VEGPSRTGGRPRHQIARSSLLGAALVASFAVLEWIVLLAKAPRPLDVRVLAALCSAVVAYALIGLAAGFVVGVCAAAARAASREKSRVLDEPAAPWALLLAALLGFYWVYAANLLYPGHSREPVAFALDVAALAAALATALGFLAIARRGPSGRALVRWTFAAAFVLWLPFYVAAASPAIEQTRSGRHTPTTVTGHALRDAPNLLLVMLDTTRIDCLGCYGGAHPPTPNIDAFADESVLFEQCVTPEPLTRPTFCTLLTGLYPRTHGVDTNTKRLPEDLVTIAEVLGGLGYETAAFTGASVLSGFYGTDQGFRLYSEPSEPWWYMRSDFAVRRLYISLTQWGGWWVEIPARQVNRQALRWLRKVEGRPFFAFVHYFDPHAPYEPPAAFDFAAREGLLGLAPPYADPRARFAPGYKMPADYLRKEWLRYTGEVAAIDAALGELLDGLRELGLAEGTVVIVVGDHGEGFERGYYFAHGDRLYDTLVHVPLFIRAPGRLAPLRVARQVRVLDVFPTALSLVGAPPQDVQGIDLTPLLDGRGGSIPSLAAYSQTDFGNPIAASSRVSTSVRADGWKYIESPGIDLVELYDLASDPAETVNLAGERPAVRERLATDLERWRSSVERRDLAPPELSPERREALRALGYIQ